MPRLATPRLYQATPLVCHAPRCAPTFRLGLSPETHGPQHPADTAPPLVRSHEFARSRGTRYTLVCSLFSAHSSSGQGHRPLKAEITGSNPVCATSYSGRTRASSIDDRPAFENIDDRDDGSWRRLPRLPPPSTPPSGTDPQRPDFWHTSCSLISTRKPLAIVVASSPLFPPLAGHGFQPLVPQFFSRIMDT
jgi:hypothetical protein